MTFDSSYIRNFVELKGHHLCVFTMQALCVTDMQCFELREEILCNVPLINEFIEISSSPPFCHLVFVGKRMPVDCVRWYSITTEGNAWFGIQVLFKDGMVGARYVTNTEVLLMHGIDECSLAETIEPFCE